MKPTALNIQQSGNLGGESIDMTIDTNALAHLMTVLTDLYSDPEMAVIREISTNAYDANVDAGNPAPIEVSLPNAMKPYFTVKDQGVGLNVDEIRDVYSKYGASTKRGSNDVVGMLGLGCKAPLTYTEQFTVVGIKGGVKTSVVISRKTDGTGVMQVVDTSATDEPNGVTVTVPVNRAGFFKDKAMDFYRYWKAGAVLVDGRAPEAIEGTWLTDDILFVPQEGTDTIVMGNVPYKLSNEYHFHKRNGWRNNYHLIYFAKIGEVNFPPSREELMYTKLTTDTIIKVREAVTQNISKAYRKDIDEADNHTEAYFRAQKWTNILGTIPWHYKGQTWSDWLPTAIEYRTTSASVTLHNQRGRSVKRPSELLYSGYGSRNTTMALIVLNLTVTC